MSSFFTGLSLFLSIGSSNGENKKNSPKRNYLFSGEPVLEIQAFEQSNHNLGNNDVMTQNSIPLCQTREKVADKQISI